MPESSPGAPVLAAEGERLHMAAEVREPDPDYDPSMDHWDYLSSVQLRFADTNTGAFSTYRSLPGHSGVYALVPGRNEERAYLVTAPRSIDYSDAVLHAIDTRSGETVFERPAGVVNGGYDTFAGAMRLADGTIAVLRRNGPRGGTRSGLRLRRKIVIARAATTPMFARQAARSPPTAPWASAATIRFAPKRERRRHCIE